jgi:hypothetical protein
MPSHQIIQLSFPDFSEFVFSQCGWGLTPLRLMIHVPAHMLQNLLTRAAKGENQNNLQLKRQ